MNIPPGPAPGAPTPNPFAGIPLDVLLEKYRLLRDKKDEIKERHSKELAPVHAMLARMEQHFLGTLQTTGQESAKTPAGTVFISHNRSYSVEDPAALRAWAESEGYDVFENRVSKPVLDQMVADGHALPPGISVSTTTRVNVRAPSKK